MIPRTFLYLVSVGSLMGCTVDSPAESDTLSLPLAGEVRLGGRLFAENTLSRDSSLSCATCHVPSRSFTEARSLSHGIGARARRRNTPSLVNVAVGRSDFDWDGRAPSLEAQLLGVFARNGDMGIDLAEAVARLRDNDEYAAAFKDVYGHEPDAQSLLSALSQFQRTLVAKESRFTRFYLGSDSAALSASEKRGWALFRAKGCGGCHVPLPDTGGSGVVLLTDGRFHNLGVGFEEGQMRDLGRYDVTLRKSDWGSFRTPPLHDVANTAPYMHDGSLETLEEVVDFYARGGNSNPNLDPVMVPRQFSRRDRLDLVAFLRALEVDVSHLPQITP